MTSKTGKRALMRREMQTTAVLAAPLVLGHMSSGLIGFVDSALAGHHGTDTLAGVSVGNALYWLPMMVPMGVLMALPPFVSELDGAGKRNEVPALFRQSLWLALGLGIVLFALLSGWRYLLGPMGIDAHVIPHAQAFVDGIRWGIPAFTFYLCMRYLSDGLHWTLPTMVLGFGGLLLLVPLGYAMAFGAGGFPPMGAFGLGAASAIMLWTQAICFALYLWRSKRFADLALFSRIDAPNKAILVKLLKTGLPIGGMVAMEGGLFITTSLLMGRLGATPAAAHQIAINVASLCFMIPMGIAEATTVRVGHALGQANSGKLRRAVVAGYTLLLLTQTISAALLIAGNTWVAGIYTNDTVVATLASQLLILAAIFQLPDGVQVISAGALRGLKDTRVPMLLAAFAYWGIGMPVGAGLGLLAGYGPAGMWVGLTAGLTVAAVCLSWRAMRTIRKLEIQQGG